MCTHSIKHYTDNRKKHKLIRRELARRCRSAAEVISYPAPTIIRTVVGTAYQGLFLTQRAVDCKAWPVGVMVTKLLFFSHKMRSETPNIVGKKEIIYNEKKGYSLLIRKILAILSHVVYSAMHVRLFACMVIFHTYNAVSIKIILELRILLHFMFSKH